jgi:hypothetical protein
MLFMGGGTLIAWLGWWIVLMNINPMETNVIGFMMFYITLIVGLVGVLTIVGISYRVLLMGRKDVISREVKVSFRHAILLSLVSVISLALSAEQVLYWWVLIVLIGIAGALEYVSLLVQHARRD